MKQRVNPTLVGAFVVGAVMLAVAVVVLFGPGQLLAKKIEYVIFFKGNVGGLRVGAPVKLRGIEIGTVKKLNAVYDPNADIYVEILIETIQNIVRNEQQVFGGMSDDEADTFLLRRGLRAQLAAESMVTGLLYVKLDYFPDHPIEFVGLNKDYPEIPSIPTAFEELEKKIDQALSGFKEVPVDQILQSLDETLAGLDSLVTSIEGARINDMLASLQATLDESRILIHDLDAQIAPTTESLRESTAALVTALDTGNLLLASLDALAVENRHEIKQAVKDLSSAAQSLRNLTDYLDTKPEAIIFGK